MSNARHNLQQALGQGRRRAFTLAEALLSATILAIISASATLPFIAGAQQAREAARMEQAVAMGEAMMEEIMARPFFVPSDRTPSPGPDAGLTRETFDNIDDFHGYAEAPGEARSFKNVVITDSSVDEFWRSATVEYVTFPNQSAGDTNSIVRITVRVFDGTSPVVTLSRIACRED